MTVENLILLLSFEDPKAEVFIEIENELEQVTDVEVNPETKHVLIKNTFSLHEKNP